MSSEEWLVESEDAGTSRVEGGVYTDLVSIPLRRPPDGGSSRAAGRPDGQTGREVRSALWAMANEERPVIAGRVGSV